VIAIIIALVVLVAVVLYIIFDHSKAPVTPPVPPPTPGGGILPDNVHLTVVNNATGVSANDVAAYIVAQQLQINNDFQPYWGGKAIIDTKAGGWPIYLVDFADIDGALGYHDVDANGVPFAKVFVQTSTNDGVDWESVASHEVLETLTDSNANTSVTGPDGCQWYREASDAVEDVEYSRNGVPLSDFVTPNYFVKDSQGPYDFLAVLKGPFTITDGGYVPESCGGAAKHMFENTSKRQSVDRAYHVRKK